jgi:hypothetical protein
MRGMIAALVLACGLVVSGCNNAGGGAAASESEKQAMASVMSQIEAADRESTRRGDAGELDNGRYAAQLRQIDLSATPPEFREYVQRWVEGQPKADEMSDLVYRYDKMNSLTLTDADRATLRQMLRDFGTEKIDTFNDHELHDEANYAIGVRSARNDQQLIRALRIARRNQVAFPPDFQMGAYFREQVARDD